MTSKFNLLLEKYSKKFKLDLRYFFKNGSWTSLYLLTDLVLGFLFSLVLIKNLSTTDLGLWYWILSIFSLFTIFTLPGFNIITRKYFIEKKYLFYKTILKIRTLSALLGSLLLVCTSIFLLYTEYANKSIYFLLMASLLIFSNFRIYVDFLYSQDKHKTIALFAIFKYVSYYTCGIILLFFQAPLEILFFYFLFIQYLIDFILTITYYFKSKKLTLKSIDKSEKTTQKGFQFTLITSFEIAGKQFDKIIIPIFLSLKDLAIYGIALIIPNVINGLNKKIIYALFFKKINNHSITEILDLVKKNVYKILGLYFVLYLSLIGLSIIFFDIILKLEDFSTILLYSQLLLLVSIISVFTLFFRNILETRLDSKTLFKFEFFSNSILIILQVISLFFFGILGIIFSKITVEVLKIIYLYYRLK